MRVSNARDSIASGRWAAQGSIKSAVLAQNLANELLTIIFLSCLDGGDSPDDRRCLLAITSTCTRWRSAAVGSPRLWNQIAWRSIRGPLPVRGVNVQELPHNLERFRAYIHRSKTLPLDISFTIDEDFERDCLRRGEVPRTDYDEAWSLLCKKHALRCRSLQISSSCQIWFESRCLPLSAKKFARLERLDLDIGNSNAALFDSPSSAPLKELRLHDLYPMGNLLRPALNTQFLERLTLAFEVDDVHPIRELLNKCPRLLELDLDPQCCSERVGVSPMFDTPSVKILRVSYLWPSELQDIIVARNVVSLSIAPKSVEDYDWDYQDPDEPLPENRWDEVYEGAFEWIGGGGLQEFELRGNTLPNSISLPYLKQMAERNPLITSLRLVQWPLAWSVLWHLLHVRDKPLLSEHVVARLTLDEDEEEGDEDGSASERDGESSDAAAPDFDSHEITVASHSHHLLPALEVLVLDQCSLEPLGLSWNDIIPLIFAVLRSRPLLRLLVREKDAESPFESLTELEEFGDRVKLAKNEKFPEFRRGL